MTSSFESTSFIWSCSYVHHVSHQTIWCPLSKAGHNHPLTQCSVFVRLCFCFDGYAYISSYMHNTNVFIHIAKSVSRQLKVPNCFAHQTPRQGAWTCSSSDYRKRSGACLGPQLETYETWKGAPKTVYVIALWQTQAALGPPMGGHSCQPRPISWSKVSNCPLARVVLEEPVRTGLDFERGREDQQQWVK